MDAPLLIQPIVLPHEAQTQAHNFEVAKKFPLAFYESTYNHEKSGDIRNIETLAMRKDTGDENIFHDYFFTHETTTLTSATLATRGNFRFLKKRLGLNEEHLDKYNVNTNVDEHIILSPFDFQDQTILAVPTDLPAACRSRS